MPDEVVHDPAAHLIRKGQGATFVLPTLAADHSPKQCDDGECKAHGEPTAEALPSRMQKALERQEAAAAAAASSRQQPA